MQIFLMFFAVSGLEIYTDNTQVIENDSVLIEWQATFEELPTCFYKPSFYEASSTDERAFEVYSASDLFVKFSVSSNSPNLEVHVFPESVNINKASSAAVNLKYHCIKDESANVFFKVSYLDKERTIGFIKICGRPSLFDWSTPLLAVLSTAIVFFSTFFYIKFVARSDSESQIFEEIKVKLPFFINHYSGIYLILLISITVLLYGSTNTLKLAIEAIIQFISFLALFYILEQISNLLNWTHELNLFSFGTIRTIKALSLIISLALTSIYIFTKSWILNNIFCISITYLILTTHRPQNIKIPALLLCSIFVYCLFWEISTPGSFGSASMISKGSALNIPIKLAIPTFTNYPINEQCSILGISNLIIPGFLLVLCATQDSKSSSNYLALQTLFYFTSLIISASTVVIYSKPLPAFLFISPILLITTLVYSLYRREFSVLWKGNKEESLIVNEMPMKEFN